MMMKVVSSELPVAKTNDADHQEPLNNTLELQVYLELHM
jgi:hypothetical protein